MRIGRWRTWFASGFCQKIADAVSELRGWGVSSEDIRAWQCANLTRPHYSLQKSVVDFLRSRQPRFPEVRMRRKLERWDIPLFPRLRGHRAVAILCRLANLVPPRVSAAVLRTFWSGWCTSRRFGGRAACLFCSAEAGDSIEHASICRSLATFGHTFLHLPYYAEPGARRLDFLLLDSVLHSDDTRLILGALRVAAAYRTHCHFRRSPALLGEPDVVYRALGQAVKELVQGHSRAMAAFDARWSFGLSSVPS